MGRKLGQLLGGCVLAATLAPSAAAQELAIAEPEAPAPRLTFERTNRRLPRTGDPI